MKKLLPVASLALLFACNNGAEQKTANADSMPQDHTASKPMADSSQLANTHSDTTQIVLPSDNTPVTRTFIKDSAGIVCKVVVPAGKRMIMGELAPTNAKMNIRFNQVITPAGKADGPFDKKLAYDINKEGTYTILIGNDLMAEGDYKGKVELKIWAH
ncbi:MAG: hypothetical protein J0I41_06235 [Filimonas sp.]|nr:hypothetical protein [Filimonas sp.]